MRRILNRSALAAAAGFAFAPAASGTWSILVADTRTGEVVLATATCLTNSDLRASTPVVIAGVGCSTAQSFVEATGQNRTLIRDGLQGLVAPGEILQNLQRSDAGHQTRQYGIVDTLGRAATFSGRSNGPFAGGVTGQIGDVAYAVQGNVITGPCVLEAAVSALQNTPGSLGDRVIAAMEAVRVVGGDGRCSCNPDGADTCGCPPPGSPAVKSAHTGVMFIARAGDGDRCNGVHRVGGSPTGLLAADLNGDGRPDLIAANTGAANLSILTNIAPAGASLPAFVPAVAASVGNSPRAVVAADFDLNGRVDLLAVNSAGLSVTLLRAAGVPGAFAPGVASPLPANCQLLVAGEFTGDPLIDAAATSQSTNAVFLLRNTGSGFAASQIASLGTGASILGLAAGELAGGGPQDLAVAMSARSALALLRAAGGGAFDRLPDLACAGRPQSVVAADVDRDGRTDLVAPATSPSGINLFFQRADGGFDSSVIPLTFGPSRVAVGDADGDGTPDLLVTGGLTVGVLRGLGNRQFAAVVAASIPSAAADFVAADLNGDGLDDVALSTSGLNNSVLTLTSYGGAFDGTPGCANGDYFFSHNVAFQQVTSPDPVFQLAGAYQAFKASRLGTADAIASTVEFDRPCLPADGVTTVRMTISPRDHTGSPVAIDPHAVAIRHARGSSGRATVQSIAAGPAGTLIATLVSGPGAGTDRFDVSLPAQARPVTIMPRPALTIAIAVDVDRSGAVDPDDLGAFIACYFSACPGADANGDGTATPDDLSDFITAFFNPCG